MLKCGLLFIYFFLMVSPSMDSPPESFFRYLVISVELSAVEAEILTRGKEPEEESSAKKQERNFKRELGTVIWFSLHFEMT